MRVAPSPELHTLDDGRVLIRAGAENRPLTGEQVRLLAATKSTGDFESEAVAGATRAHLDEEVIEEYLKKRESRQCRPTTGTANEILVEVGALTADEATYCCGAAPQVLLPQSGFVFVKFIGADPRGADGQAG